jgi:hypothetical protein
MQEAYVQGVSTRAVDDLVQAMGMSGISKSQVSRAVRGHREVRLRRIAAARVASEHKALSPCAVTITSRICNPTD